MVLSRQFLMGMFRELCFAAAMAVGVAAPAYAERWVAYFEPHTGVRWQLDLDSVLRFGDIATFNERIKEGNKTFGYSVGQKVNCRTRRNWTSDNEWSTKPVDEFPRFGREGQIRRMAYACK